MNSALLVVIVLDAGLFPNKFVACMFKLTSGFVEHLDNLKSNISVQLLLLQKPGEVPQLVFVAW